MGKSKHKIRHNKEKKVFNTMYKRGDKLECIKDVVCNEETLFQQGESYIIDHLEYSQCGYPDKTTKYQPFYFISKYPFFSPNEEFITDEETHGGQGMSGFGNINVYFKKNIE